MWYFLKRQGINSACSVNASRSVRATSGDELPSKMPRPHLLWRELKNAQAVQLWLHSPSFFTLSFIKVLSVVSLDLITSLRAADTQWGFGQGFRASGKQQHTQNMNQWCPKDCHRQPDQEGMQVSFSSLPPCVLWFTGGSVHADKWAALSTKLRDSKICLCSCQGQRRGWKHMFSEFGMSQFR